MLRNINQHEFEEWHKKSEIEYAKDKMKSHDINWEEALALAQKSFQDLLPNGLNSKNNFIFALDNEGEKAGLVWFALRGKENDRAFIYDVIIEEKFRGRGLGRRLMQLAEAEAVKLGAIKIGLHVFGFNQRAINLYQSLNYQVVDLVMEKKLN